MSTKLTGLQPFWIIDARNEIVRHLSSGNLIEGRELAQLKYASQILGSLFPGSYYDHARRCRPQPARSICRAGLSGGSEHRWIVCVVKHQKPPSASKLLAAQNLPCSLRRRGCAFLD